MKKLLVLLLVLLIFPVVVMAAEEDNTTTTTTTTNEVIEKSPDTGVEDYFLTLGIISVSLGTVLYILNKKSVFQEI